MKVQIKSYGGAYYFIVNEAGKYWDACFNGFVDECNPYYSCFYSEVCNAIVRRQRFELIT